MRDERDRAQAIANTAESLLKTEQAAQKHLAQQLRQAEADMMTLRADLGFFERLLPAQGDGLALRGVQFEPQAPGQMRYQLLVMQSGKGPAEFRGRYATDAHRHPRWTPMDLGAAAGAAADREAIRSHRGHRSTTRPGPWWKLSR